MRARDVREQRPHRRGRRRGDELPAGELGEHRTPGQEAYRGTLHVAFAPRDLAGKAQPWQRLEPQRSIEKLGAVEEGVAVQPTEAGELRVLEAWDQAQDAHLLTVFELGLEADHVPQRAEHVVLAQLNHG